MKQMFMSVGFVAALATTFVPTITQARMPRFLQKIKGEQAN
jgi:outer membrane lipoprotein-sorting protein